MKFLFFDVLFFLSSLCFGSALELGESLLEVEIANTQEERARGLMFRENLPEGSGMLFVFEKPGVLSFWMKNTLIPLSVAFFDEDQKLLNIEDMYPFQNEALPHAAKSVASARYALEVPQGWFSKQKIAPGMKFSFLDQDKSVK